MMERLLEGERALIYGLADRAEEAFRAALAEDPHNAVALVGLARVALQRDDDATGLRYARAALEVDPANEMAQRLVARLEEIAAARAESEGQPVTPRPAAGRPSEQAVFGRNPSMADHRRREGER
jgi:predicted Zn-dependent protease